MVLKKFAVHYMERGRRCHSPVYVKEENLKFKRLSYTATPERTYINISDDFIFALNTNTYWATWQTTTRNLKQPIIIGAIPYRVFLWGILQKRSIKL